MRATKCRWKRMRQIMTTAFTPNKLRQVYIYLNILLILIFIYNNKKCLIMSDDSFDKIMYRSSRDSMHTNEY
jgi:hypothetical protein